MKRCTVSFQSVLDYSEGRLDEECTERIRAHVRTGCQACRERLDRIASYLPELRQVASTAEVAVPVEALARAKQISRELYVRRERPSLTVKIARLLFDSRLAPTPAGARSVDASAGRRIYGTNDAYIYVWEERGNDTSYVIGVMVPASGGDPIPVRSAQLLPTSGPPRDASLSGSEFHLAAVPAGTYTLRVERGDEEIVAQELTIGQ